jgi:tetratricopeptide (TPR) repeat protein
MRRRAGRFFFGGCCAALFALLPVRAFAADSFVRRLAERALERGELQEARGDIAQALTSYDEAVRTDTTFAPALLRLGALRERLGDVGEAELLYTRAAAAPEARAAALHARALLRHKLMRRAEALLDLARAAELTPDPHRLRLLGSWYVEERRWTAALSAWRALLAAAERAQDDAAIKEAELTVSALSWLAAETDAVLAGALSPDWVRRSLSRMARRSPAAAQGARKLTP